MGAQISKLPKWASGASADVVEPAEAKKEQGWVGGATPDRPPAQYINWFQRTVYENLQWFRDQFLYYPISHWTEHHSNHTSAVLLEAIAYSPALGIFVAVGRDASTQAIILSSPDGETWTVRQSGPNGVLRDVVYDSVNGRFVAIGGYTPSLIEALIYTSPDGETWSDRSNLATSMDMWMNGVCYDAGSGNYIAVGNNGAIATSSDSDSSAWLNQNPGISTQDYSAVAADGNQTVVAVGTNPGSRVFRSSDGGVAWSSFILSFGINDLFDVWWDGERFITVGDDSSGNGKIIVSATGESGTWSEITGHEITEAIRCVRKASQGFYVCTTENGGIWAGFLVDQEEWSLRPSATVGHIFAIAQATAAPLTTNHYWVAVGDKDADDSGGDTSIRKGEKPLFR